MLRSTVCVPDAVSWAAKSCANVALIPTRIVTVGLTLVSNVAAASVAGPDALGTVAENRRSKIASKYSL